MTNTINNTHKPLQSNYLRIPDRYGILALSVIVGTLLVWCSICDTYLYWMLELKLGLLRIFISSQVTVSFLV